MQFSQFGRAAWAIADRSAMGAGTGRAARGARLTEQIFRVIYKHPLRQCAWRSWPRRPRSAEGGNWPMAVVLTTASQVARDYWRLFVNRRAYTVQSMRPQPENGRHYYFRPKEKGTDAPLTLTE